MPQLLYNSHITKVKFNLSGTETVEEDTNAKISSSDFFKNNIPQPGGVYDPHLGTTDHLYRCQTCFNKKEKCLGHEGHIELNYPLWNPIAVNEIRKWLKLICRKCGKPVIEESTYIKFPKAKRLDEATKIARPSNSSKNLVHCGELHPIFKKDVKEPLKINANIFNDKSTEIYIVYPHMAQKIFSMISNETVIKLGKNPNSHPRNFVLRSIKVPPVTIRPDVKKIGGNRSTNDDLTTILQMIIKQNEKLPFVVTDPIDEKLSKSIFEINNKYYDFIRANSDSSTASSIATRLKSKQGRLRKNIMGKRVRVMMRSTIVGDCHVPLGHIVIPLVFALTIQYEETVQEWNKKRLLIYIQNGRKKYPGATKIVKRSTGMTHELENMKDVELENGDIIFRDIIDGDPAGFNRQPSLMDSNICTNIIKVNRNPDIKAIAFNVIDTPLYNADFDGDAMHIIPVTTIAGRNEISQLSSIENWFISRTTSSPALGQTNDSIVGLAELTRSNIKLDKYHAMLLFQYSTTLPDFSGIGKEGITGRECIDLIMEETPINYIKGTKWYNENMVPYMEYNPDEIKVVIEKGKMKSGILDKSTISATNGSIYHVIAGEYGAKKALKSIYNMQQLAISYTLQSGFTIGLMDLLISKESKEEIDKISSDIINKSRLITEQLQNGEIIPPINKTVEEYFEEQQISNLRIIEDFNEPIFNAIDAESNNLFKMIMFGAKGKLEHLYNMVTAVGQKLINGERMQQKFGFKRTLPYFTRFDDTPEARGYIANSYLAGVTSTEYIFNAMASRFDIISKALSTSITGEQNRKSIKNLESIIVNNIRFSMKNLNIIDFGYGEDFLDPRYVEKIKFPTVMISNEELKKTYFHEDFPAEFEKIKEDRELYRKVYLTIEDMNERELISDYRDMPINISRIIIDITGKFPGEEANKEELRIMVKKINVLCEIIPYTLLNSIQEKNRTKIPVNIQYSCIQIIMIIRSYLHPNALLKHKINNKSLDIIIDKIRYNYAKALIDPGTCVGIVAAQSFSAPLTQYMLDAHHRSASGGTSKTGMVRAKEVLGAKDNAKLTNPSMLIPVLQEYESDEKKVLEIANNIEVMKLKHFIIYWQIYFEKFGNPVHSKTKHEKKMIDDFVKVNPLIPPPGDLTRWCIRFVLNKTTMILKNMSVELLITKLRELFPGIYIVYSPENSPELIVRIYMRNNIFKSSTEESDVLALMDNFFDSIIRGVSGINNARVIKMLRNKINPDGSISKNENIYGIKTNGTNIADLYQNTYIDRYKIQTDAIQETYRMFGIEAARQKVISGIRDLVEENCNHRHYLIYANEMTYTGKVTSIESSGLKTRESSNILLRTGFSSPLITLEEAAKNSMEDSVTGVTGPLIVGSVPRIGTLYNEFHIDNEFVKKNIKNPEDIISVLFE
jgi:DNA-directed RNA polymerase beta' subunit